MSGVASPESATGTEEKIHGLPTYVAKPEGTPKGLIVIIADAFGWDFINLRVIADKFAKKGDFLVYLPDFMNGTFKLSLLNYLPKFSYLSEYKANKAFQQDPP